LGVDAPRRRRHDAAALAALAVRERGDPAAVFRQTLRDAGAAGLARAEAAAFAGDAEAVVVVDRLYHREVLAELAGRIAGLVADYNRRFPLRLGIPKEEARRRVDFPGGRAEWVALCEVLAPLGGWVVAGDRIAPTAAGPPLAPALARAATRREEALVACGLQWPGLEAFREALAAEAMPGQSEEEFLKHLVDHDRAVQAGSDYYVAARPYAELVATLRRHFDAEPELTFARFRELSGLSRKLGIPLLEHLDQAGLTVRIGDNRRAGPALAAEG
ncbi:MAG: SelB domain-containing protein, partial [Candidatus Krumholzibacteriia bacterium]